MHMDYIWAPGRMKWITGKKPYNGCLFCGIAKNNPKIPKKVIYRDDSMMVLMNIFPYNIGHVQIVPLRHVEWLEELTEEESKDLFSIMKKTMILLKKALKPKGFNAGVNLGSSSGQSVKHLHFQIVPRYSKEVGFMETLFGTKVMPETIDQTHKRIMKHAKLLKKLPPSA